MKIFNELSEKELPQSLEKVNEIIKPIIKVAVQLTVPIELDPLITAIK
ncbi:hypothetical protein [Thermosipho sp. 1223]|nr:hypothetical protein [Thermosipho sp. 1223]